MSVRRRAEEVVDFLLPTGCISCGAWIPAATVGRIVCDRCRSRLRRAPWPRCARCDHPRGTRRTSGAPCLACAEWPPELSRARTACVLEGPAEDLVHGLKYEGWTELAGLMGTSMCAAVASCPQVDAVVPVPTTERRIRARGYNQAALLAQVVGAQLGLPVVEALIRRPGAESQTSLTPEQRRANVRGVFAVSRAGSGLGGLHALLVDDVLTTGATAGEAARCLAAAGAVEVTLLSFARALGDRAERAA